MEISNGGLPAKLPKPWHWEELDLTPQLRREIPNGHILSDVGVKSIARRQDNDDVLFELQGHENRYAVVHLTWAERTLRDPSYPTTRLYKDWDDVYLNRILLDSNGWED